MRRTVAPTIIDKPDDIPVGVNLDDPVYRANLDDRFRRQTDSHIEKLSRIYDENPPDHTPSDSSHSSPGVAAARKSKSGRKCKFVEAHWSILRTKAFELLAHYGGLGEDEPEFNSKSKLINLLLDFAQNHHRFKDVGAPGRTTMQERVDLWLGEWQALRAAEY